MSDFLSTPLQFIKGVGPRRAADLSRVGLQTVEDLLRTKGESLQFELLAGASGLSRPIEAPDVSSPGLVLAGHFVAWAVASAVVGWLLLRA